MTATPTDLRDAELSAIAEWFTDSQRADFASDAPQVAPGVYVSEQESLWHAVLQAMPVRDGLALFAARDDGTLRTSALYWHLNAARVSPDLTPREIGTALLAHARRSEHLRGDGSAVGEETEHTALGVRARCVLRHGRRVWVPYRREQTSAVRWRGVPSDPRGRALVGVRVSGSVPRPDDRRFAALVRDLDAAMRKLPGRNEAARREQIAARNRAERAVSVSVSRSGTASAGLSRRKRRRKRR